MSTITAATGSPGTKGKASVRQLWQAPVFVAGVAALLAVWLSRPSPGPDPACQLEHYLAAAREQLARPGGDAREAVQLAQLALEEAERLQQRKGEALFLLGTAYLRLGDRAAPKDASLARGDWCFARDRLKEAWQQGVPPEAEGRLQYRLGKVCFLLKDPPEEVVKYLAAGAEQAEDRAEAYGLLTQAYLALNPPNLAEALRANERLRQEVPRVDESVLAPAKLLGGELLLRMGKPEKARKVLEKIGEQAPAAVLGQARLLRARTYQDEGKWKEAAELWKAVLEDQRAPPPEPGQVLYNLGVCHRGLDELREAAAAWEECRRKGRGDEVAASVLALAELRLHEGDQGPEPALALFQRALGRVRGPEEWTNSLIDLPRVRELVERAIQASRQGGHFEQAVQLCGLYEHLVAPGRGAALRAELYVEWAGWHKEKAAAATDSLARQNEENAVRDKFRQAGAARAEAAERAGTPAEQAEHLWQSARCFLQGEDYAKAAGLLERFLERNPDSAHQGEGWYLLADAYRHVNQQDEAIIAYKKCIEWSAPPRPPTPYAFRARYHLALAAIEKNQIDQAEEILTENLKLLHYEQEPWAHEKSLFTLGDLLYRRREYKKVVQHLEPAIRMYPSNPETTRARYQLADSYRLLASQEHTARIHDTRMSPPTRQHFEEEHQRWLEKAAERFEELAAELDNGKSRGHLAPEEEIQVPFIAANCFYNLGDYDRALARFNRLAARYRGQGMAEVLALEGAARVYAARRQFDLMQQRLADIRAALPTLPEKDRAAWEKWLQLAGKMVPAGQNENRNGQRPS